MGDFYARIGLGTEDCPNSNWKRLLDLERFRYFVVENKLQCFVGRWAWESWEKKSLIDYQFVKVMDVIKMVVEDSGNFDIASNHNIIWGEVVRERTEGEVRRERCRWRVDEWPVWDHYQKAVEEEFIGWEKVWEDWDKVREGCSIEEVCLRCKEKVLAAAGKE